MENRFNSSGVPASSDWGRSAYAPDMATRQRVLRNTYLLLAISMVPTVLGAWIGVASGVMALLSGGLGMAVFLIGAFGFMYAIERTKQSGTGVLVLLGFTFFMGLMLAPLLSAVLGRANGARLIMTAFAGTGGVFAVMAVLSSVVKRDLSGMGQWLFVGALVVLFGGLINLFLGSSAMMLALSTLCVGIFSLYMLYDLKRIIDGGETNYISATLALYLDIYNVFQSLLVILGLTSDRD